MPTLSSLVAVGSIYQVLIWVVLAFCFWLVLNLLIRRLQVPSPVLVAATLSWFVAWLSIWAVRRTLHEVWSCSIKQTSYPSVVACQQGARASGPVVLVWSASSAEGVAIAPKDRLWQQRNSASCEESSRRLATRSLGPSGLPLESSLYLRWALRPCWPATPFASRGKPIALHLLRMSSYSRCLGPTGWRRWYGFTCATPKSSGSGGIRTAIGNGASGPPTSTGCQSTRS